MFWIAKTEIEFNNYWLDHFIYKDHSDYDLAGHCQAIALKSESGSVYDFYRSNPIEDPKDFKWTKAYTSFDNIAGLLSQFQIESTRVRIHKQLPNTEIPLHTDDNNTAAKTKEDYRLRMITALNDSPDFIYRFEVNGELHEFSLEQGQTVIFDPDKVKHGMVNKSNEESRFALVQIFKAYPLSQWLKDFISEDNIIEANDFR